MDLSEVEVAALIVERDQLRADLEALEAKRIRRDTYEGCCRAAVDSEGFAHDHAEWFCDLIEAEAKQGQGKEIIAILTGYLDWVRMDLCAACASGICSAHRSAESVIASVVDLARRATADGS